MDQTTILYLALAAAAYFLLPKLGLKLPSPVAPDLPSLIKQIIDAVLAEILPKIPSKEDVQTIVKAELAARPPVVVQSQPSVETLPDGSLKVSLPK